MLLPNLTHSEIAHAFAEQYRKNFKVIPTRRNTLEVFVKGDGRQFLETDVKKYHLRRILRAYLDFLFNASPEPSRAVTGPRISHGRDA
jgi:hypothetical protein